MSNELVKYDPELNTVPLRRFTPIEMNLFFFNRFSNARSRRENR